MTSATARSRPRSDAIWVLDQDGTLTRIDPASNRISGRFATGALETFTLATGAGYEWICECGNNHDLLRYDARTRTARRFTLLEAPLSWRTSAVSLYVPRTFVAGFDGRTGTLWFLNAGGPDSCAMESGHGAHDGAVGRPRRTADRGDTGPRSDLGGSHERRRPGLDVDRQAHDDHGTDWDERHRDRSRPGHTTVWVAGSTSVSAELFMELPRLSE